MKYPSGQVWHDPEYSPKPGLQTQALAEAEKAEFCPQT
jgi:hypothetical protein